MKKVSVRLPDRQYAALHAKATEWGHPMAEVLRWLLDRIVDAWEEDQKARDAAKNYRPTPRQQARLEREKAESDKLRQELLRKGWIETEQGWVGPDAIGIVNIEQDATRLD